MHHSDQTPEIRIAALVFRIAGLKAVSSVFRIPRESFKESMHRRHGRRQEFRIGGYNPKSSRPLDHPNSELQLLSDGEAQGRRWPSSGRGGVSCSSSSLLSPLFFSAMWVPVGVGRRAEEKQGQDVKYPSKSAVYLPFGRWQSAQRSTTGPHQTSMALASRYSEFTLTSLLFFSHHVNKNHLTACLACRRTNGSG